MIPAQITVAFDPASTAGDITVIMQVRGTKAERLQYVARIEDHAATEYDYQYAAAKAIKQLGDALTKGEVEWTTELANHGLPDHMLRVSVELDDLTTDLDKLNAFVSSPAFSAIDPLDQSDLLAQQAMMQGHKQTLINRLSRARGEQQA